MPTWTRSRKGHAHAALQPWPCVLCDNWNGADAEACVCCAFPASFSARPKPSVAVRASTAPPLELRVDFFQASCPFPTHVMAVRRDRNAYWACLHECLRQGIAVNSATRARVLATAWAVGDRVAFDDLCLKPEFVGVGELLKALQLLDAPRAARQVAAKLERLRGRASARVIGKLETNLTNLRSEQVPVWGASVSTLTRALAERVRKWVSHIPASKLEFFLLSFPTAPWQALANLSHTKPGDFSLPYFLPACFDAAAVPADSLVAIARSLTPANLVESLAAAPRLLDMYSHIRRIVPPHELSEEARRALALGAPLGEVIWWFQELQCPGVEAAITARLIAGEPVDSNRYNLNFGKLMERLLMFVEAGLWSIALLLLPAADAKLAAAARPHMPPPDSDAKPESESEADVGATKAPVSPGTHIAVLGDASGSMQVAIKTATILGGLLSACTGAELSFFHDHIFWPSVQPRCAKDVVTVAQQVHAGGCTRPAAALQHYCFTRTRVDLFIVVTDEEETNRREFANLWLSYKTEVHPEAQVLFCSFLQGGCASGPMQKDLVRAGCPAPKCFLLNAACPDLCKFDSLLAMVAQMSAPAKAAVTTAVAAPTNLEGCAAAPSLLASSRSEPPVNADLTVACAPQVATPATGSVTPLAGGLARVSLKRGTGSAGLVVPEEDPACEPGPESPGSQQKTGPRYRKHRG